MSGSDYFTYVPLGRATLARASDVNARFQLVESGLATLPAADKLRENRVTYVDVTGTNTLVTALTPAIAAYTVGLKLGFRVANTNSSAATLNVNSKGAIAIKRNDGSALIAGDLVAGRMVEVVFDGTFFVLTGDSTAALSATTAAAMAVSAANSAGTATSAALASAASAAAAAASATAASGSATAAAGSATAASTSAGTATTQAGNASASATAAAGSATAASGSATAAAGSATAAGNSATAAANSAAAAAASAASVNIPSLVGQNGKYLGTDGSTLTWQAIALLPAVAGQSGKYLSNDGTNTAWTGFPANYTAFNGLTGAADKVAYFTGAGAMAVSDLTSVARTLLAQTTQANMRTTGLGLGTAATVATGTSGATIPLLNGANTWSGLNDFTGGLNINGTDAYASPIRSVSAAYTLVIGDRGWTIYHPAADTTARIWTIPANSAVAFPVGTIIAIENENAAGAITLAITTDTLMWGSSTGSRTIAAGGGCQIQKMTSTTWRLRGEGIS